MGAPPEAVSCPHLAGAKPRTNRGSPAPSPTSRPVGPAVTRGADAQSPPAAPLLWAPRARPFPDVISCGLGARGGRRGAGRGPGPAPHGPALPREEVLMGEVGGMRPVPPALPARAVQEHSWRADLGEAGGGRVEAGAPSSGEVISLLRLFCCFPPEEPPHVLFVPLACPGSQGEHVRVTGGRAPPEPGRWPGPDPLSREEPRRCGSRGPGQVRDGPGFELGSSRCP